MPSILVPLDGSPASDRAVKHVAFMTDGRAGAEVHLLHVQPPLVPEDLPQIARPGLSERLDSEDIDRAFGTASREMESAGLRYTAHIARGDPAQEIAFYADVHGCDQIVMGTRGLGPIKNLLMGSVATKVLHLVNCSKLSALALALVAGATAGAQVPDAARGRALYENHCTVCHTERVHTRPNRTALTREEVREIVDRWQRQQALNWSEQDTEDVVEFLGRSRYHFAPARDRLGKR